MITNNRIKSDTQSLELCGLSSDPKPTTYNGHDVGPNSVFKELDTGNTYFYTGSKWAVMGTRKGEDGGAGLPTVTSEDNGKVLGVVNGAWDKTEASSGSDDFTVTATLGIADGEYTISDVSDDAGDIADAVAEGKKVRLVLTAMGGALRLELPLSEMMGTEEAYFGGTISGEGIFPGAALVKISDQENTIKVTPPSKINITEDRSGQISIISTVDFEDLYEALDPSQSMDQALPEVCIRFLNSDGSVRAFLLVQMLATNNRVLFVGYNPVEAASNVLRTYIWDGTNVTARTGGLA